MDVDGRRGSVDYEYRTTVQIEWKFIAGFLVPIKHPISRSDTDAIRTTTITEQQDAGTTTRTVDAGTDVDARGRK